MTFIERIGGITIGSLLFGIGVWFTKLSFESGIPDTAIGPAIFLPLGFVILVGSVFG